MNAHASPTWSTEYHVDSTASPTTLWRLLADVTRWPAWNSHIEEISFPGPFAAGTAFTVKPASRRPLQFRLVEVQPPCRFVDETTVGELTVAVTHDIQCMRSGLSRVSFTVTATGDGCDEVGPVVAADYPQVLPALARLAEARAVA